jgi:hypothetical protein
MKCQRTGDGTDDYIQCRAEATHLVGYEMGHSERMCERHAQEEKEYGYEVSRLFSGEAVDWDELTPSEAKRLLDAFGEWSDHNEPNDEDKKDYERLRKIADQEQSDE